MGKPHERVNEPGRRPGAYCPRSMHADPERQAEAARELGRLERQQVRCLDCQAPFTCNLMPGAYRREGIFCAACIARRVYQVRQDRERKRGER